MRTLTALDIRVSAMPLANFPTEDSLQGATKRQSYLKLPEEGGAKRSSSSYTSSARP